MPLCGKYSVVHINIYTVDVFSLCIKWPIQMLMLMVVSSSLTPLSISLLSLPFPLSLPLYLLGPLSLPLTPAIRYTVSVGALCILRHFTAHISGSGIFNRQICESFSLKCPPFRLGVPICAAEGCIPSSPSVSATVCLYLNVL